MAFWGDYHTHTKYSHGKGTVLDNAEAAARKGIKQIAITDHGLSHWLFGIKRKELPALRRDCEEAIDKTGVCVLVGIENNINSFDGTFDLTDDDLDKLDIIQGGYHKAARAPDQKQEWTYQIRNMIRSTMKSSPRSLIVKNTDSYLKLLDNYEVDFLGHLNRDIRVDALTVARYAKEKGTYIEINSKRNCLTDIELEKMAEDGVQFVCNSDAHSPERVGDMSAALAIVDRIGIPYTLIANWERFPSFRSLNYARAVAAFDEKKSVDVGSVDSNVED